MNDPVPSAADGRLRSPWQKWRRWLLIGGIGVLLQSITVTLPTAVRYVDAGSGSPLIGLPVTAVWRLDATHPAGSLPSTVLKVRHIATDRNGEVRIGFAVMVHAPNFPFGFNMRRATSLPRVYVADERSEGRLMQTGTPDSQRPALSVLSLQRTSIHGATFGVSRPLQPEADAARNHEPVINPAPSDIQRAESMCRQRWLCQED